MVRASGVRPSIKPLFLEKPWSWLTPNLGERYLSTMSPDSFFKTFIFLFINDFFLSLIWDHMGEKIQTTSPLKVHSRFTCKISGIVLGRVSTKVVHRIVNFQILDFFFFFFSFSLYGAVWEWTLQTISPLKAQTRITPQNSCTMYTSREGLYQSCQQNCEIWTFGLLGFVVVVVLFWPLTWLQMGNYKMCDILKMASRGAKRTKTWAPRTSTKCIQGTFDR